jgi:three-Cys-motif partner protein
MSRGKFFGKPFDEGTLTKLEIFELYAREWLPVFLSRANPIKPKIQIFDFFAGPGLDSKGQSGSPLRLLKQLNIYRALPGWSHVAIHVHFFDKSSQNVKTLKRSIENSGLSLENVALDIRRLDFETAFEQCSPLLKDRQAAKLVFIDQFGVDQVTDEVFRRLINFPTCDFLFFIFLSRPLLYTVFATIRLLSKGSIFLTTVIACTEPSSSITKISYPIRTRTI